MIASPFFRCRLHGTRIAGKFPAACPLGCVNPLTQIGKIRDSAWVKEAVSDYHAAEVRFEMRDVCNDCLDRGLRHPHVRFLREQVKLKG
jgi:hypothetical protein